MLQHILDNPNKQVSRSPLSLILIAWLLAIMALAGPVWRETPQPVHEREDALVIIFDLSRSMLATDVKPDRLVRAKRKLIDLLELRDEGVTALIVFAGDAHTVSPLTDDTNTITAMIPALSPDIVPAPGSRLTSALKRAIELFEQASVAGGILSSQHPRMPGSGVVPLAWRARTELVVAGFRGLPGEAEATVRADGTANPPDLAVEAVPSHTQVRGRSHPSSYFKKTSAGEVW